MPNIEVSSNIHNLLIADSLPEYKAALNALGASVWNFVGAYSGGTPYAVGDVVTYQGQTWYRTNANGGNVGDTPSEGTFWTILAQAGAGGGSGTPLTGDVTTLGAVATIAPGAVTAAKLGPGAAAANITLLPVNKGGTGVASLLTGVNSLLASTTTLESKAALTTLGVGTAGFLNTGVLAGNVPVLLAGGKLPILDGSNLTGIAEFEELHPTRLVLNDLSGVAAEAGTLAYKGPNLAKHDGTTVGGVVIAGGSGGGGREGFYEEVSSRAYLTNTPVHEALIFSQQVSFLPVLTPGVFGFVNAAIILDLDPLQTANYIYILSASISTTVANRPLLSADFGGGSVSRHLLLHTGFAAQGGLPTIVAPNIPFCDVINISGLFGNNVSVNCNFQGKSWNYSTNASTTHEYRQNLSGTGPPNIMADAGLLSMYVSIINKNAILHGPEYPTVPWDGAMWFNTTTSLLEKFSKDSGTFEPYTPSGGLVVQTTFIFGTYPVGRVIIALGVTDAYYVGTGIPVSTYVPNFPNTTFRTICTLNFPS